MNLLCILNSLALGGAENYTVSLLNNLACLGHKIELRVLSNETALINKLNSSINLKVWNRKCKIDFNVVKKLRNDIINNNYQAIISSSVIYTRLSTLLLNNHILILYPIHSTIPLSKKYYFINYLIYHSKKSNEVFITSIRGQTYYLTTKYNLKENFFNEIHNGIDTSIFKIKPPSFNKYEFLRKRAILNTDKIILMVAGFRPEKQHLTAISAFRLLIKEYPNIKLIFIGNDTLNKKKEIQKKTIDLTDKVFFFTDVKEEDLIKFYWCADIFTLTSDNETFPISALEAMATGLPCVLTDVGGIKDFLLPGTNGELSKVNDPLSIKDTWKKVLLNKDKYIGITIRQAIVEKYSLKNATENYMQIIRNYLSEL